MVTQEAVPTVLQQLVDLTGAATGLELGKGWRGGAEPTSAGQQLMEGSEYTSMERLQLPARMQISDTQTACTLPPDFCL